RTRCLEKHLLVGGYEYRVEGDLVGAVGVFDYLTRGERTPQVGSTPKLPKVSVSAVQGEDRHPPVGGRAVGYGNREVKPVAGIVGTRVHWAETITRAGYRSAFALDDAGAVSVGCNSSHAGLHRTDDVFDVRALFIRHSRAGRDDMSSDEH